MSENFSPKIKKHMAQSEVQNHEAGLQNTPTSRHVKSIERSYTRQNFLRVDPMSPEQNTIEYAVNFLKEGRPIIFPTDTVYGVGVAVRDVTSPKILYRIKQRDASKAIPWLVEGLTDLIRYSQNLQPYCIDLATNLWPGPLTLVVEAASAVPKSFTSDDSTIALRAPNSIVALSLMRELSSPIATTSANISGRDAANDSADLDTEICKLVPAVLDGGIIHEGKPSTVVICTKSKPKVVREGAISKSEIMSFVED